VRTAGTYAPISYGWGAWAFTVYNHGISGFSIHFGPLFLVWVAVLGLSTFTLLGGLATLETAAIEAHFTSRAVRTSGWFLIGVAVLFALLWLRETTCAIES
jgi:hypothetical protein